MSIFTSLHGFSFINENKGVVHVDVSALNNSELVQFANYLNKTNLKYNSAGGSIMEIWSDKSGNEIIDLLNKSNVGSKLKVKIASVEDFHLEVINDLDTRNYSDDEFKGIMNKYRADIDSRMGELTAKINSMEDNFDPYKLTEIKNLVLSQSKYIEDLKGKLELESSNRKNMQDYINTMRSQIDNLNVQNTQQTVEIQRVIENKIDDINVRIDDILDTTNTNTRKVEGDIRRLVTEFDSIRDVREKDDARVIELERKIDALSKKLEKGDTGGLVNSVLIANIAEDIETYTKTRQKTVDEITAQHMAIEAQLKELKDTDPENFKIMTEGLGEITKTKIAILNVVEAKKKEGKPEEEDKTKPEGEETFDFGKKDHMTGNQYVHTIHLPIDKMVILNDLEKIKVIGKQREKKFDPELDSTMAKVSRGLHNLMGYDAENEAAHVLEFYSDFRDAVGSLTEWIFANPVAMLTGIAGGTVGALVGKSKEGYAAGADSAATVGEFIKHEMIQNPGELNPAIIKFENWVRDKLHLGIKTEKPVESNVTPASISENMEAGAVATPDTSSGMGATPGTTFDTGLSISGAGAAFAPTETKDGSGDKFEPVGKKQKKKKKGAYKQQHRYVPFQIQDFATYSSTLKKINYYDCL